MRMREIAHRFQIVLEAVVHRDQRHLDQLRFPIHDALEVLQVDPPVAGHDDAKIEPRLLQLHQVHERSLEMQRIGDDVAIEFPDAETFDDEILPGARVGDVADLRWLGVDERSEGRLRIGSRGCAARANRPAPVHHVAVRAGGGDRHRMRERAAEVRDAVRDREVRFSREA
jgi:hypothetical protein